MRGGDEERWSQRGWEGDVKIGQEKLTSHASPSRSEQPQDKSSGEVDGRTRRRERRSEVRAERLARAGGKEHERSCT